MSSTNSPVPPARLAALGGWLRSQDPWLLAARLALALMIPLAVRMSLDVGLTWDETVQRIYGDHVLAWYTSGFSERGALSYINLYLYGGLFDLPAQWVISTGLSPWGVYETRHVLTALVAVGGIVATWLAARRIAGPRAAFAAGAMLALTPAWVGHGLFNPKDIPFGTAAAFLMYACTRIAMRRGSASWRDAVLAGVSLGFVLGIRAGGMFMVAYPIVAACLPLALRTFDRDDRPPLRAAVRDTGLTLGRYVCVLPLAWIIMLSAWPWAQQAPFTRPFEAAASAAHFPWGGKLRFDGAILSAADIPRSYLLTWFEVTLPDVYLVALACGVISIIAIVRTRKFDLPRMPAVMLLVLSVLAPFAGVLLTNPTLYDAHRHFLFVMPLLAALAGIAFERVWRDQRLHRALRVNSAAFALLLASVTIYDLVSLHPYEYVYFNRAHGGLRDQAARFDTDYWGATYREGFEWVVRHVDLGGVRPISVWTCFGTHQINYYRRQWKAERFRVTKAQDAAEIRIAFTRLGCHERVPGEVLHVVERQGVPLLYVFRRNPSSLGTRMSVD